MTSQLATTLSSPDLLARIEAVATLVKDPDSSRPTLVAVLDDPSTAMFARLWAMIAICQIGDDQHGLVARALIECLLAPQAIVRRSAIETLGMLKVASAVPRIADHLTDQQAIPEGWFDDSSTPAQAAQRALQSIGTPAALQALRAASRL